MNGRRTQDGCLVGDHDIVYEIMYRYVNRETSLAEAESRQVCEIPLEAKIWKHKSNCISRCYSLNRIAARKSMYDL